ncbi:hypothetical protein KAR91_35485 [Candidatus Pacearchaeota archaeon]|nr:hypothetical protein [Candidatus Pacearchaeota archaeon]
MGIPPPPTFGDDCDSNCFAAGATPGTFYIAISGMEQGAAWQPGDPGPPNRTFTLPQNPGSPCIWRYDDASWIITYTQDQIRVKVQVFFEIGDLVFQGFGDHCGHYVENDIIVAANNHYYLGEATIWSL